MITYNKHSVISDLKPEDIDAFASDIKPLPLPVVNIDDYIKSIPNFDQKAKESIGLVEPSEKESDFTKGADGRVSRSDSNFYPTNSLGKLVTSSGSCSAAMIAPNIILTAGHCVHPGGTGSSNDYYSNIYFQPSHPDHGRWYSVTKVFAHSSWINSRLFQNDLAICVISENININDYWGVQTLVGDSKYGWTTYGYPAEGRFNGVYPYFDGGPLTVEPWSDGSLQFNLVAIDHIDFTGGSSGGPWITNGRISRGNIIVQGKDTKFGRPFHINGVNSFMFDRYPGIMVSPYFGSATERFIREVLSKI